jgi:tetratricopeptide (TPR) repeat protein
VLYNQLYCHETYWHIKVPPLAGAALFALLFIGGVSLIRFNCNNLRCDRYYLKAISMEQKGHAMSALSEGLAGRNYNPYRMDIMTTIGRAYAVMGDLKNAITTPEEVLHNHPFKLNALFFLGIAYAHADENEKALETFIKVLQIKPDYPAVRQIVFSIKAHGKARVNLK